MITASNLTKYYGSLPAISNVSFDVKKGEILGFLGPNGAGKSTTIRILTGFLTATHGRATIGDFDINDQSMEARKITGYVPENPPLYMEMTVEGFLNFQAKIKGVPKKSRKGRIDDVLDKFKIGDVRKKIIGKLSKGYRQRVGLAQALVHNPQVLFLDEPTVGLDPRQIIDTREIIHDLAGQHTVLLSTHILPEVSMVCNRVVIINEGRVVAEDSPEHLVETMKGSETVSIEIADSAADLETSMSRDITGIKAITRLTDTGSSPAKFRIETLLDRDIRSAIAAWVVEHGLALVELRTTTLSLEEIYLKLTTVEEGLDHDSGSGNQ